MPSTLHTHDLIIQLKAIKEEQGLTIQNIYETLENNGCHVSLNTIKKIFSEGSENQHFQFHNTLQPISRVLLRIYGEAKGNSEIDGLRAAVQVKDELIDKLEREIVDVHTDSRRRVDYLKHQIELKDQRIGTLMERVTILLNQLQKLLEKL